MEIPPATHFPSFQAFAIRKSSAVGGGGGRRRGKQDSHDINFEFLMEIMLTESCKPF